MGNEYAVMAFNGFKSVLITDSHPDKEVVEKWAKEMESDDRFIFCEISVIGVPSGYKTRLRQLTLKV